LNERCRRVVVNRRVVWKRLRISDNRRVNLCFPLYDRDERIGASA